MFRTLFALLLMSAPAAAGCFNYSENPPAPRVVVCLDTKCEMTTIDFVCANVHGSQSGFANGWKTDYSVAESRQVVTLADGSSHEGGDRFVCLPVDLESSDDFVEGCG